MKLLRLHGKLLFCHKTFAVAYDGPKIMPVMEIIRHKTFAVVRKTVKYAKVSCHESFMVYGICG